MLCGYAHSSSGSTTGTYRRLRPLSTRRFGQPRRLGSRRASSPCGGSRGRLVHEILCLFPGSAPLLLCSLPSAVLFPSPLGAKLGNVCGVVSSCMAERVARTRQLACGNVGLVLGKVGYTFSSVARLCRKSAGWQFYRVRVFFSLEFPKFANFESPYLEYFNNPCVLG